MEHFKSQSLTQNLSQNFDGFHPLGKKTSESHLINTYGIQKCSGKPPELSYILRPLNCILPGIIKQKATKRGPPMNAS